MNPDYYINIYISDTTAFPRERKILIKSILIYGYNFSNVCENANYIMPDNFEEEEKIWLETKNEIEEVYNFYEYNSDIFFKNSQINKYINLFKELDINNITRIYKQEEKIKYKYYRCKDIKLAWMYTKEMCINDNYKEYKCRLDILTILAKYFGPGVCEFVSLKTNNCIWIFNLMHISSKIPITFKGTLNGVFVNTNTCLNNTSLPDIFIEDLYILFNELKLERITS